MMLVQPHRPSPAKVKQPWTAADRTGSRDDLDMLGSLSRLELQLCYTLLVKSPSYDTSFRVLEDLILEGFIMRGRQMSLGV